MRKWIWEPIYAYKEEKNTLEKDNDYQIIGILHQLRMLRQYINDYKLRHLKLGKIKYGGKPYEKRSFTIENISWNISWQVDRYLAIIIRDYIRFHIKESPVIGNCVLRDNPEKIPYEDFLFGINPIDIDFGKRWKDLALGVADEFDELRSVYDRI